MNFYYSDIPHSFSTIVTRLKETPDRLDAIITDLPGNALVLKPDGKWSIQEHIGHLLCIESLWIARLDDLVLGRETVRPWNGTNADTDAGRFNDQNIQSILRDFRQIREMHTTMLAGMENQCETLVSFHAGEGRKFRLIDLVWMMLEHDEEHLKIIASRLAIEN